MARRTLPAMTRYRPGTSADSRTCFDVFETAVEDLGRRIGAGGNATAGDPDAWAIRRPMFDHLAATADRWWIAEDETTGSMVGYARSIVRDGVRELTEFFVLPTTQSGGIGRELLERTFPGDAVRHRAIVATIDPRAIARYLKVGLDGRLPMVGLEAAPRVVNLETNLVREPIARGDPPIEALAEIDRALLGFRRDADHRWLASQRPGWLYRRDGEAVAYGYHPTRPLWGGPYAALVATDLPVLLADGESAAARAGHPTVTFDLALTARTGFDHLLSRGYRIDPFVMVFFTDGPIEGLDRYVLTSPPFFA
jgi:GNAT superfamily N-acetyltransferase